MIKESRIGATVLLHSSVEVPVFTQYDPNEGDWMETMALYPEKAELVSVEQLNDDEFEVMFSPQEVTSPVGVVVLTKSELDALEIESDDPRLCPQCGYTELIIHNDDDGPRWDECGNDECNYETDVS